MSEPLSGSSATYGLSCFYYRVRILASFRTTLFALGTTRTVVTTLYGCVLPPAPPHAAPAVLDFVFFVLELVPSIWFLRFQVWRRSLGVMLYHGSRVRKRSIDTGADKVRRECATMDRWDPSRRSNRHHDLIVTVFGADERPLAWCGDTHDRRAASNLHFDHAPKAPRQIPDAGGETPAERNQQSMVRGTDKDTEKQHIHFNKAQ